jgi:threonine dehydrogenase-like Zn-dependent dehydrogenase
MKGQNPLESFGQLGRIAEPLCADKVVDMRLFKPSPKNVPRALRNSPEGKGVDVAAELAVIARAIPEGLDIPCHGGRLSEIGNGNLMDGDFEGDAAFMVTSHEPIIAVVWAVGFVPGDCAGRAQKG